MSGFDDLQGFRANDAFCRWVEEGLTAAYRRVPTWHRAAGVIYQVHREGVERVAQPQRVGAVGAHPQHVDAVHALHAFTIAMCLVTLVGAEVGREEYGTEKGR